MRILFALTRKPIHISVNLLTLLFLSLILFSSCEKDFVKENVISTANLKEGIKDPNLYDLGYVKKMIKQDIGSEGYLDYRKDLKLLYSIAMYTDSTFTIGYQPRGFENLKEKIHKIDFKSKPWVQVKNEIIDIVTNKAIPCEVVGPFTPTPSIERYFEPVEGLPYVYFHNTAFEVLEQIAKMEGKVSSISVSQESLYYDDDVLGKSGKQSSTSGCSCSGNPSWADFKSGDYDSYAFGAQDTHIKTAWNLKYHDVHPVSWSLSTGDDIGICIIDSGIDERQENLDMAQSFNTGIGAPREEYRQSFLPKLLYVCVPFVGWTNIEIGTHSVYDECSHGTKMAGLAAAPRGAKDNNSQNADGNVCGVAYSSNLYNFRATFDPIINRTAEKWGVARAIMAAANNPNIHIISMSIGTPFNNTMITDAIDYADGMGKMINCAAGTSPGTPFIQNRISFPANLPNTNAITGIKTPDNINYDHMGSSDGEPCDICWYDNGVDYAVVMQGIGYELSVPYDQFAMTVTCDGDAPQFVDGSSSATALFSGMAALVWSKFGPTVGRGAIESAIQQASTNPNNDHPIFGHGYMDLMDALL